jgi:hypothetical protein
MIETILFVLIGVAMLVAVAFLVRQPAAFRLPESAVTAINLEELTASHCRFLPLLRQTLSTGDEDYLFRRASPQVVREWREARRRVLRQFLSGLYGDFARLNRLARAVSRTAPKLDHLREAELFWMSVRFRVVYFLAVVELKLGLRPVHGFLRLADLVGTLGSGLELATAALARDSGPTAIIS